ncbi:DUF2927 domain-containing protein [Pseudodonghicola flavimaris]|uniref:DUF2927 domain-containing protein n=1 Tax=Pseudodonghicola flavimaris TaxID=3050036 RepID=A0ABT7EVF3_9RHOB|nr:DUF2927 domain-containing protein [Pseudodonghicola flavimaris]MDK3016330.1 DUF2927 domain-containing protein [Pseudodonghicola flavimaris]
MIRAALLTVALALTGCATVPMADLPSRAQIADSTLPPMKAFSTPHPSAPSRSNANIAADFLDLHFELESGRRLEFMTRFETPITIRVVGNAPASLSPDLRRLLSRLRREAGIDIHQVRRGAANITIEPVSRAEIRRALPQAACFVVPNVSSFDEFRRDRRKPKTSWSALHDRSRMGIFVPYDSTPQELRDCLHEELAQALGPLNDLYRLPDSVFNDDNVHTVLTGFDMLILRATYAPELRSGMTRAEVASRLPAILSRMNPGGDSIPQTPVSATPRNWIDAVQTSLGPNVPTPARRGAAATATRIAQSLGWSDHRLAFNYYMQGRLLQLTDPDAAQTQFRAALDILNRRPETRLHAAQVVTQTAAYAIATGHPDPALSQIEPMLDIAQRSENAALLATLMMLKAEALDMQGQSKQAESVRLDSLGWARYGFGSDWAVRAKMREIAALNPQNRERG